jgi:GlcNAc-PI de-N-acetylase
MKMLSRWLMKRLSQGTGRYLQFHGLLQVNKCNPALLWQPEGKKIVVLAPHMDDEVIGCGGTLYKHIQRGATVTVIYLTDGRYGGKRPPPLPEDARGGTEQVSLSSENTRPCWRWRPLGFKTAFSWMSRTDS